MNFDLKKLLKNFKLNENNISTVLGALVVVIVGILVVNYFKDRSVQTTLEGLNTQNQVGGEHVVVSGETLWSISEDTYGSGYNWVDVKEANSLTSDLIEVGQKLTLPEVSIKEPTAIKKVVVAEASQVISGDSYIVASGDSLWKISVRAYGDGFKWVEVAKANNLGNPNLIHSGNVLVLPR